MFMPTMHYNTLQYNTIQYNTLGDSEWFFRELGRIPVFENISN